MIIDGRAIAAEVLARTKVRAERLPHPPKVLAYGAEEPSAATRSYLKIKKRSAKEAGCIFEEAHNPTNFINADAAIVQLPTTPRAMEMLKDGTLIPPEKDADVLSPSARAAFARGDGGALLPPVVGAVAEIFARRNVEAKGKRAVVIGKGFLVGEPAAAWLSNAGAHVTALASGDDLAVLQEADIIVSGAGSPHLIKPEMIREGVILIDAGTSEASGKLAGDADPACAPKCAVFTPVPGGIGPIAVAYLFHNAVLLAERAINTA